MNLSAVMRTAEFDADTPVSLAAVSRQGHMETIAAGRWPDGSAVVETDWFYAASLSKQLTAAAAARLMQAGRLDADAPVARYMPDLPDWATRVTARQLAHHIAGLPADNENDFEDLTKHWTEARALAALGNLSKLPRSPGQAYVYSNLGYVLLAEVLAHAAGKPFPEIVSKTLMQPLGIEGMAFAGPAIGDFPQASLLGPVLPLTVGDGGLWSTAQAFGGWLQAMNADSLDLASVLTQPGRLSNGETTDYGWGIGLRQYRGAPLYIHGGEWTGAVARAVRSPSLGLAVVAFASGPSIDALGALVDAILDAEADS